MDIQERFGNMGRPLQVLTVLTALLSIGGIVTSITPVIDGEAYANTRLALGLAGATGAALILFGRDYGKSGLMVVMAWAAMQSIYYATVPDGNYSKQLVDVFMGVSSEVSINGVTDYNAIGLNLVGLAMLAFAYSCRSRLADWQNRETRGFQV